MNPLFPLLAALLLISVHVFSGYLRFLDTLPRNRILSAGAGITVAFVVLQLLPSVAAADQTISGKVGGSALSRVDDHAYAIVLVSIVIFFAVEQWARICQATRRRRIGPAAVQAFIAGGVLLNVFSEEFPEERQSRLGAFAAAALIFGALLIFL